MGKERTAQDKKGKGSLAVRRRYDCKQSGCGRQTKPVFQKKMNITDQKITKNEEEKAIRRFEPLDNDGIETLRKVSRQEYLKKREQKKLDELRDDIEDEQYLFEGVELSEAEYLELRYKKEIHDLAKKGTEEAVYTNEYRMPEAYDQEGGFKQAKRFSVALQRYRDPAAEFKMMISGKKHRRNIRLAKQLLGLDLRIQSENMMISSLCLKTTEFIKTTIVNGVNVDQELSVLPPEASTAKTAFEKLQVLVIVGETGSGKTTQIP